MEQEMLSPAQSEHQARLDQRKQSAASQKQASQKKRQSTVTQPTFSAKQKRTSRPATATAQNQSSS